MNEEYSSNPSGTAQDAAPVGDGDDGSMFDTEHTPSSKGDNSTDVSWNSSPTNSQCDSFQSIQLLKSRPLHLAVFLHHVITQFDPAPLVPRLARGRQYSDLLSNIEGACGSVEIDELCYLYAELYKQTNSKENRRVFTELHTFFIDRGANLKVAVPESVSADLARRRTESTPEEINRHVQTLQDSLDADIQKNLEDFRHKRNMGLTLAEVELAKLDQRVRDHERAERAYAEKIITKIEDVLKKEKEKEKEEEKCSIMQYVIRTYMKHLGVRVEEPRNPESKWVRFFPKIKKSIKTEKEGEEKVKKPSFPSIRGPQPQPSRVEAASGGTPTSGCSRLSDSIQSDHLDDEPLDQLQEEDRESDRLEGLGATNIQSEDNQATDSKLHPWYSNWQQLVGGEVLAGLTPHEIQRQEVIHDLLNTERAHVRTLRALDQVSMLSKEATLPPADMMRLKVLDQVFLQNLSKEATMPPDIKNLFTNLEEILQLHVSIQDQMVAIQKRNESAVIAQIGDDLLSWFGGGQEEKIKQVVGTFCSNQAFALEIIMTQQEKDSPFTSYMQEAESKRQCRRQQLKDIIRIEMQRLIKYDLLLESIAKYTDDAVEKDKVKQAGECCRRIFNHVNQAVKESDDKQRLEDYQRRLVVPTLKKTDNPMILELKNLDLTKKTMVREGPLSWKVNKDKTIELNTLLLEDILVLLQKQDEHLILKCVENRMSKKLVGTANTKDMFSPIIKLNTVLSVRPVATDDKSFFVISMSENGEPKMYELMAPTVSDQRTWQRLITQRADAMKVKPHRVIPLPQTDDGVEIVTTGVSRLAKWADRMSTGSTDKESSPAPSGMTQSPLLGNNPFEEVKMEEGEEEAFVDPELPYQAAEDSGEGDSFNLFPSSPTRAEKALKELASLKQVFITIMSQEASERGQRSSILRTTSVRIPVDSRARVLVDTGSEKSLTQAEDPAQDLASGDTGFFDSPEDYAGCPVLEGYRGPGEGTINDDIMAASTGKQLSTSQDSGINLRFSSASAAGSLSSFRRQALSHLRNLQSDLNYLKDVEFNNIISQSPVRSPSDTDGNKKTQLDMTQDQRKVFLDMTQDQRQLFLDMTQDQRQLFLDMTQDLILFLNMTQKIRETDQYMEESKKLTQDLDDVISERNNLERELQNTNKEIEDKERELRCSREETEQKDEELRKKKKEWDYATSENTKLERELQNTNKEIEDKERELRCSCEETEQKDEELRKKKKEWDYATSENTKLERQMDDMNQQMIEKERELQNANKEVDKSKIKQQQLTQDLQDLTKKEVTLTVQLKERERELENIKRTLIEKDEALRKMKKELDDVISDKSHVEDGENTDSTLPPKRRDCMERPADKRKLEDQMRAKERELQCSHDETKQKDEELRKKEWNNEYTQLAQLMCEMTTEIATLSIASAQKTEDGENTDSTLPPKRRDCMERPADSFTTQQNLTINPQEAEKWLSTVRKEFINRVSEPFVKSLLDELLGEKVITYEEMESVRGEKVNTDKARAIIDMVCKKGNKASLKMIDILHQLDRHVSDTLREYYSDYKEKESELQSSIQRDREERKDTKVQEIQVKYEKELKNSLEKIDGSIQELRGGIGKIDHQLTEIERQKKEVKDEKKKRELEQEREQMKKELKTLKTEKDDEIRKINEKHRQEIEEIRKIYEGDSRARVEAELMEVVLPEIVSNKKEFERQLDEKNREMTTQLEKLDKKNKEMTAQLEKLRIAAGEGGVARESLEKTVNSLMMKTAGTIQELFRKSHHQ